MARQSKKAADGDHNLMGEDDQQALLIHHFDKLRQQEAKCAEKKAEYDAERSALNDLFSLAKADKFSRKELQALLDDSKAIRRDLVAEEERRSQLRSWLGLPAGSQGDLFASTPQEAKDELAFEGDGYAAGLRGVEGSPPDTVPARFVQAWMRGYHDGQEKLAWGLAAAGRVIDRRTDIAAQAVPLQPEPEVEPEEQDEEAAELEAATKLVESGWTQPTGDEASFEAAH